MNITSIKVGHPDLIQNALWTEIQHRSRFTAVIEVIGKMIKITSVRLQKSKEYCGNHAKACENQFRQHRKHKYLEGADWIEFNDLINNLLDRLDIICNVASSRNVGCIIRKGALRRIYYDANTFIGFAGIGEWRWDYDSNEPTHWKNNLNGQPMFSKFPIGTPGIHSQLNYNVVG